MSAPSRSKAAPKYNTVEDVIGNTPLVRLVRVPGLDNDQRGNVILGKLEGNNPAGSVKDRPAISMIRRAEERGEIKPGDTLIGRPRATPASLWRWQLPSAAIACCS